MKTCLICKKQFKTNNKHKKQIVCSNSCAAKYGYLQRSVEKTCIYCKENFRIDKNSTREYCEKHRKMTKKECLNCKKEKHIRKDSKFCSSQCSYEYNSKATEKEKCSECGSIFNIIKITNAKNKNKFCSDTCKKSFYKKHYPSRSASRYGRSWRNIREKIIKRDNNKCLMCSSTEKLEVHHFIKMKYFKNVEEAHFKDNLGTFCNTCHYKVEKINYTSYTNYMKDIVCP